MGSPIERWYFAGRDHVLFAEEADIHHGRLDALALPQLPPGPRVRLTGERQLQVERVGLLPPTIVAAPHGG